MLSTYDEELDAEEKKEVGDEEEEEPLGVLAEDLEGEMEDPEQPDGPEDDGLAESGVGVGSDVDGLVGRRHS